MNGLEFFNYETTIAVITGYLRKNKLLIYNIKTDDLIKIISKYSNENSTSIQLINNKKFIKFDTIVQDACALTKEFIVAATLSELYVTLK